MPCTRPRLRFRSPMTSPMCSSGVTTSTRMIGSSSTGPARMRASFKAIQTQIFECDRLEHHRTRTHDGFLEGHRARDLECDLARVHLVERAVEQRDLDINDRESG